MGEEKRRLEGRLATLEEDLEEEQMNSEAAVEKARKALEQVEQMSSEVAQSQSNISKLEKTKGQLEKQVSGSICLISESYFVGIVLGGGSVPVSTPFKIS